jgi:hypothetical protein
MNSIQIRQIHGAFDAPHFIAIHDTNHARGNKQGF